MKNLTNKYQTMYEDKNHLQHQLNVSEKQSNDLYKVFL